jgi:hypothetical protein
MPRMQQELAWGGVKHLNPGEYWMKTEPHLTDEDWSVLWGRVFDDYKNTPPYPGAIDFLTQLHGKTQQPIHFITSRNAKHATATHKMMRHYLKCPFTISFANRPFSKLDYIGKAKWMVEDNPHEVQELLKYGIGVIMPRRVWNENSEYSFCYELDELHDNIDVFTIE